MTNRPLEVAVPDNEQSATAQTYNTSPAESNKRPARRRRSARWNTTCNKGDEEYQWTELIEHLPDNVRIIWRAVNDLRQFWRLLHAFGGQSIRVPRILPKSKGHALRKHLGVACLRKLMAVFGGTNIYVPRCTALVNLLRQRNIIKDFSHTTRRGSSSTAAVANLARRHGISDRRVWQILKKENSVPPHARLILRLGDSAQQASRQTGDNC